MSYWNWQSATVRKPFQNRIEDRIKLTMLIWDVLRDAIVKILWPLVC